MNKRCDVAVQLITLHAGERQISIGKRLFDSVFDYRKLLEYEADTRAAQTAIEENEDEWHILVEFPERSFVEETPPLFGANIRERWATSKATQIIGSSCAKAARCDR